MNNLNLNSKDEKIGRIKTMKLAWTILSSIKKAKEGKTPEESRLIAREQTRNIYDNIFKELGINVEINFSNEANDNFPNEVEALNEYILNAEISDEKLKNISSLFLGNHTRGSTEALGAYSIVPNDTRIQLKDILCHIPGILSLDPIIFYRNKLDKKHTKKRNGEIQNTIGNKKRVLIFPEGTRVKGSGLGKFQTSLYKPGFDKMKSLGKDVSQVVTIITTDNHDVFPDSLEKSLFGLGNAKKGTIRFTIDFIDASNYDSLDRFNKDVKKIIKNNLPDVDREGITKAKFTHAFNVIFNKKATKVLESVNNFYEINFDKYKQNGKKGIILDVDDCIAPHHGNILASNSKIVSDLVKNDWKVVIFSNMKKSDRYKQLEEIGVEVITSPYAKPDERGFEECLEEMDLKAKEVIMIGDNFLTDGGSKRAGIDFIKVKPIERKEESPSVARKIQKTMRSFADKVAGVRGNI